jgi:hypothetical protein
MPCAWQLLAFGLMLKPRAEDEYNGNEPSVIIDARDGSVQVISSDCGHIVYTEELSK